MDPLSVTASIIAILQLSGKVLMYLNDVKDASKDRARCAMEVSNLHSLLFNLRFHLEEGVLGQSWYTAVRALAIENGPLDQFKGALEMLQAKMTDKGRLGKVGKALAWNFKKEEITDILDRMERLKSLVEIALHTDHFNLSQAIKADTEYLRTNALSIESGVDAIQLQQDSEKHHMLLEWVSRSDYPAQQSTIIRERQEGTGQWFLTASEMIRWKDEVKATLFCPGIPGAGKTMVAAIAIDYLLRSVQSDSHGVAYIYCNYKAQQQEDILSLLAAILKQLSQGQLSTMKHVEKLHQRHAQCGTRPSLNDICDTLEHVLSDYLTVYIVIDALDECQDSTRRQLVAKLRFFQTGRDVRLLVTSRPMPEIGSDYRAALRLEVRATKEDLKRFVAGRICELSVAIRRDTVLQEMVQEKITEAADGMFLLAVLHTDSLLDKRTVKDVKLALANLLKGKEGLRKAYENAFQRIESQMPGDCELAKKVLTWITLAKRPLTTEELSCALAVELNESAIDPENMHDSDDLVSVCAGLVVVDQESNIIRLVHYTTQEYLEQTVDAWNPGGRLHLATTCLTYLAFDVFMSGNTDTKRFVCELVQNRFLSYAGNYWGYHARTVEDKIIQLHCAERLDNALSCALRVLKSPSNSSDGYNNERSSDRILHYLGHCGLVCIMTTVLSNPNRHGRMRVDKKDKHERTPLSYAAEQGHLEVVKLLLDEGVDVNKSGGFYGYALHAASAGGNKQVAELLLNKGARLNANAGHYQSALCAASDKGHYGVVELLLVRGAEINSLDIHYTALHRASANGHYEVVKLLLDWGAEINAQDSRGSTALHKAAASGHEQVVKLLLDRRAEINLHGQGHGNALLAASMQNKEQVVRLLLEAGADVHSQSEHNGGVVRGAAFWGNAQMMELLISKGAEVDVSSKFRPSDIYMASDENYDRVVELLLNAGVDPNIQGGEHGTALFTASMQGYEKVVKLLLERNADPNTEGVQHKNTPLYAASSKGYRRVVELLVENGANVNAQGGYYGNALFAASIQGYEDIVKQLLKKGADPNALGAKYNNTPLYAASSQGYTEIVRLLVENGADVNVQGGYWGNALVAASKASHARVVELLLKSGANSCQQLPSSDT